MRNPHKTILHLDTWGMIDDPGSTYHFAPRVIEARVQAYLQKIASRPPQPAGETISSNETIAIPATVCQGNQPS